MVPDAPSLSGPLEDYLETIYQCVREQSFARVKDIAKARRVRSASVVPAMRRLAELDLIEYVRREYIKLTPKGEREARRIYSKHQVLTRFLRDILKVSRQAIESDACAMEHHLSMETMDQLVRFFEFVALCPEGKELMAKFHQCPAIHRDEDAGESRCSMGDDGHLRVADLSPGAERAVIQLVGSPALRQRLLEAGILPGLEIRVTALDPGEETMQIEVQGSALTLSREESAAIMVAPSSGYEPRCTCSMQCSAAEGDR